MLYVTKKNMTYNVYDTKKTELLFKTFKIFCSMFVLFL